MKNVVFWDAMLCGSCKTDVLEELSASIIRVTRIGELGTCHLDDGGAKFLRNVSSYKSNTA
jgi:demethoxyubiquinone hydroxylase (CLK1/Coq7/Cat5 family)